MNTTARVLTSSRGKTVTTELTDEQAYVICKTLKGEFIESITKRPFVRLTPDQIVWLHIYAQPKPEPQKVKITDNFSNIIALFNSAVNSKLLRPKIRLSVNGFNIKISMASKHSKNAGYVYVTSGVTGAVNDYYGKISPEGEFYPGKNCFDGLYAFLERFSAYPAEVAAEYGKRTGRCCFCEHELTDDRSVKVGYGPICGRHYGLPWN